MSVATLEVTRVIDPGLAEVTALLYAIADRPNRHATTVLEFVFESPLRAMPAATLLEAYRATLSHNDPDGTLHERLRHVTSSVIGQHESLESVAVALLDLYREDPAATRRLAFDVVGRISSFGPLLWSNALADFPLDLYDALRLETTRATYLRRLLAPSAPRLSQPQFDLAHALANEWVGTLDELLATARALAPSTSH